MERTSTYIKVWFWPRNSATVPAQVKSGASPIDTSTWGTPFAAFVNSGCDIASKFGPENIIINLTFCGDWAGSVYSNSGCPGNCVGKSGLALCISLMSELIALHRLRQQQPGRVQECVLGYCRSARLPVKGFKAYFLGYMMYSWTKSIDIS
jgi:hypothetical protein